MTDAKGARSEREVTFPEVESFKLETKDQVELACSYFAPPVIEEQPEAGKSAIPFILLHDWEGSRQQTYRFAEFLQSQGHAAIAPDLRGHGRSTSVVGSDQELEFDRLNRSQMDQVINDIEACKKFLVERNDLGELNIDLLTVVAIGEMVPVAAEWSYRDWFQFPAFNSKGIKQGQDVKALVMVGPRKKFSSYNLTRILRTPLFAGPTKPLPVMIVWSSEEKTAKEADSIYKALERARPEVPELETPEETLAATTLFKADLDGLSYSGGELLGRSRVNNLWQYISNTIGKRVKANPDDHPWTHRHPEAAE